MPVTSLTNIAVPAIELTKFAMDPESKRCKLAGEAQEVVNTLHLNVSLPSGRSASLSLPHEGTVLDLKLAAQQSLGQALLRLAAPDGRLLDPKKHLQDSGLQDGDSITAVAQELKAAATESTVVLWCPGGGVVTWGRSDIGGDSARVRDQLKNVRQIHVAHSAFAAILADGSVVTWGDPFNGGNSTMVRDQLTNVQQIHATGGAFAALLADGGVITWGDRRNGGNSTMVRDQLKNVHQICATDGAFAAILNRQTFRISIAKHLLTKVLWEGMKANPSAHVHKVFGNRVHSTYGWREAQISSKRQQEPDILLQGFLRTKESAAEAVLSKSGYDGLFIDRLSNQPGHQPRPNIWWVKKQEDETPEAYYQKALAEAKTEGVPLAYRKGGGSFLGLRVAVNKYKPQLHAWTLHAAPKHWGVNEVLECPLDAGCEEVAIIRPPGRQRNWLVKAVVPDENSIGMLGIKAGDRVLYLNRVQGKVKRSEEVLQVIRPQYKARTKEAPNSASARAKPAVPPAQTSAGPENKENKDGRTRSRSPSKDRKEPPIVQELAGRYTVLDCGGAGSCGYQCLAAALALDKGHDFNDVENTLVAKGRTTRHDIYKHMHKHDEEYKPWFHPDPEASEFIEDGPAPLTWPDYLEATLRNNRWIDGLSWRAASKRFGLHIIVVPLDGCEKDQPMCFGEPRSSREPVVLLLKAGHYQLAQRKAGKQWPKSWTNAEVAKLDSPALRGGGKSGASSVASWRTSKTPPSIEKPSRSQASWRCSATPVSSCKKAN